LVKAEEAFSLATSSRVRSIAITFSPTVGVEVRLVMADRSNSKDKKIIAGGANPQKDIQTEEVRNGRQKQWR